MEGKSISLCITTRSFIKNWVDSSISPQVINLQKRTYV